MKAIVVGGGVAGLAAATRLVEGGAEVTLLEARAALGGGAAATVDEATGDLAGPGPHLFFGWQRAARGFAERLGSAARLRFRGDLALAFADGGKVRRARGSSLPPPLHVVAGLLAADALGLAERLLALRVLAALGARPAPGLRRLAPAPDERDTVDGWLDRLGQPAGARRALWHPLAAALTDDDPRTCAARPFAAALRETLLGPPGHAHLAVADGGLGALYVDAAAAWLRARGATVRTGAAARAVTVETIAGLAIARGVALASGEKLDADAVVAAVPPAALLALLPDEPRRDPYFDGVARLGRAAAVSAHLWLDRIVSDEPLLALAGPFQRLFHHNHLGAVRRPERSFVTLTAAPAGALADLAPPEIAERALAEGRRALPAAAGARLAHHRVVVAREALHVHRAGRDDRPKPRTPIDGLFLAGDWVRTDVPASVESAVRSAEAAAEFALAWEPPPAPPPPRGFVPVGNLKRRPSPTT